MNRSHHQLPVEELVSQLDTSLQTGLSAKQVAERVAQYGKNRIPEPRSKTLAGIFLHQFLNPLIYVLIAAAIISVITGDKEDAVFITAIILINAILGAYQEWRAENSAQALRDMVKVRARVKRENQLVEIDSEDIVPGDIVLLGSGIRIPADMRLAETNGLSVEEALLTGESVAVLKNTEPIAGGEELSLGDRLNMVFAATAVQKGRATGIVVSTAADTQIGKIADSLRTTAPEKPPLERRMESFSKKISVIVLVVCAALGVIGYLEGSSVRDIFFLMVAVGVSAIPEGLPVALTVALSIGTRRMAKRNVIVRKLPAVEGLGSCTLIASDKTGTLTMDEQSVKKIYLPDGKYYGISGQGYNGDGEILDGETSVTEPREQLLRFLVAAMLSNEGVLRKTGTGWEHSGDAVDVAINALAYKSGRDPGYFRQQGEIVQVIPYESERKFSAVYFRQDNRLHFAMKGAVETVLKKIPEQEQQTFHAVAEQMAAEGYRVLAVAGSPVNDTDLAALPALQVLGLIGMIDPLRPEAKDAVNECRKAGIGVVMVTGDHPATALSIARALGIADKPEEVIAGTELSAMEQLAAQELGEKIRDKKVFARVAPLQKQKIVEAMKAIGHFIAVTGDGANDAPALKSAHIGVAMGSGTDLAKEAASIIVTDNNFASIAAGVEEGRFTFENLRKIIYLLISTGAAELLTIGIAIILNMPLPFIAVQLLWLNLVTNGIQDIALSFEKGDPTVMTRPPRKPGESIFDALMNSQMIVSGLFIAALVLGIWQYLLSTGFNEKHARTMVMMLMVLVQNFHALNCRSETKSLFQVPVGNNYILVAGIVIAQLVHISAAYIPRLNTILQLEPVKLQEWFLLLPAAASIFAVMELFKWLWRRRTSSKTPQADGSH
ncbi:cation-translocating P-type ATPase [Sediminibacterium soli]|uniref:cation-translocating P-type ATPase n=1 Tax=Sediminibacterium soli TaxID=2698829 RepID=UPI00137975AA|nr:HAD-IC family P-type ATPase [Sediminibacterium soli]NCI47108.1 HAD-IC family P-type ATPase [Sediminibacterium soli]